MERILRDNLLGAILVSRGLLGEEQLALGLQVQEREGGWRKLGDVLLDLGYLTPEGLQEALEVQRRMAEEVMARLEGPRTTARRIEAGRDLLLMCFRDQEEGARWTRLLQDEGHLVDEVDSAETALLHLQQRRFSLFLLDVTGPEMLRVVTMARQLDPDLVTLAIVDYALFRTSRRGLWMATPHYLLRPFEREELLLALSEALGRRRLRLENLALHSQIEQRGRELALLTELGTRLNMAEDLPQALTQAMFRVVDIFGSQAGSLLMVDEKSQELRFEVMVGEHVAPLRPLRLQLGQGICGWVAQTGQPMLVPDVRQEPRFYAEADSITGFETRTVLAVPILALGRTVGVIEVINKADATPFTPWDQRVLMAIATLVGDAIERASMRRMSRGRGGPPASTGGAEGKGTKEILS
jgi:putative methionine-R-sulfoxide reductase with GAF domain/CheY-like chemotaxis protein